MIITNGNLIDLNNGSLNKLDIEISGGVITRIGKSLEGDKVIDGDGAFILPGLIDSHVHLGTSRKDLKRFLRSGVTTVRNMLGIDGFNLNRWLGGTRVFNHLKLREKIQKGEILGPTIITAGPLLDGEDSAFPGFMYKRILTNRDGREEVRSQFKKGYDFIKVYPSISKDAFLGITQEAKALGIKVCGHVPYDVGLKEAKEAGLYINEHLHGLFFPLKPDLEPSSKLRDELISILEENKSWFCPTLIAWERLGNLNSDNFEKERGFMDLTLREKGGMRFLNRIAADLVSKKDLKPQYKYLKDLIKVISRLEDRSLILAGTDCSLPYVVPGVSLIQEIIKLGECGLSNLEAIRCGTINSARALSMEGRIGQVIEGAVADILILDSNPLEDLNNLYSLKNVISKGNIVDS